MDSKLKELLQRISEKVLSGSRGVSILRNEVAELTQMLARMPAPDAPVDQTVEFSLDVFSNYVKQLAKDGQVQELEVQLSLAQKPDGIDLDSEEYETERLCIEYKRLTAQRLTREANLFSRFLMMARSALIETKKESDA